jgi:hypothetical protein
MERGGPFGGRRPGCQYGAEERSDEATNCETGWRIERG